MTVPVGTFVPFVSSERYNMRRRDWPAHVVPLLSLSLFPHWRTCVCARFSIIYICMHVCPRMCVCVCTCECVPTYVRTSTPRALSTVALSLLSDNRYYLQTIAFGQRLRVFATQLAGSFAKLGGAWPRVNIDLDCKELDCRVAGGSAGR